MAPHPARHADVLARYDARIAGFAVIARRRGLQSGEVDPVEPAVNQSLTRRELQVLRLIANGLRTAGVARNLGLSEETVKSHLVNLRHKLGARNRSHAFAVAYRLGLIA
jgi:DNA-binding CsgD family transcriptional regulator